MSNSSYDISIVYNTNADIAAGKHRRLEDSMNGVVSKGNNLKKTMGGLALRFVGYNLILNQVMNLQQKLVQFVGDSVKAFREFETRMAEVSTILGEDTMPLIGQLGSGVEVLSMKFGQATSDMAKGLYDILSAAFDAKDAINLLNTATKASIAGLSDIRTSVDIFTTVLNSYGMAVEQATHVSNLLFQSVIRGKFQFEDLESALGYIVPIAAQAGINFDELSAALSTATRHGLHLDMVARGLALGIQNIINPSAKATKAADKYGIQMNGLALRVLGLKGWFEELNDATKEFGTGIMGELIPNMRSLRVAMVLASDVGLAGFNDDLQKLIEMGDATDVALNKIMETSQFAANVMTQEFEKVKREVGDSWDELVLGIQRGILSIVGGFTELFGGGKYISKAGEKYKFIEDDDIENAKKYVEIENELIKKQKEIGELGERPEIVDEFDRYVRTKDAAEKYDAALNRLETDQARLIETQLEFADSYNNMIGGIKTGLQTLEQYQLNLIEIGLEQDRLNEELNKPIKFAWSDEVQKGIELQYGIQDGLKGTLNYERLVLEASQKYADVTHDVTMGLLDEDYLYKVLSDDMRNNITLIREYKDAQDDNRKATEQMSAAMRKLQIQTLEIQLKGMTRRRGLTRSEEKMLKKIQIEQAKLRLNQMNAEKEWTKQSIKNYQDAQDAVDAYVLKQRESQYQLTYTYGQQIADLDALIKKETDALTTMDEWWAKTNQDIIDTSTNMIDTLNELTLADFNNVLENAGIKATELRNTLESLRKSAGMKTTYSPSAALESTIKSGVIKPEQRYGPYYGPAGSRYSSGYGIRSYQHGTYGVQKDEIAMVHKGERIIPAGDSTKAGGGSIVIENLTIQVSQIAEIGDVEKIGAVISSAKNARIIDKNGQTRYRLR